VSMKSHMEVASWASCVIDAEPRNFLIAALMTLRWRRVRS